MLLGPLAALAALLVAAGVAKLHSPGPTATALGSLGLRANATNVAARILGVGEVAVGVWVLVAGSRASAVALTLGYIGFTATTAALRRSPQLPCGCFGAPDAPATMAGLVSNVVSTAIAATAIVLPPGGAIAAVAGQPLEAATTLALAALGAWLVHQIHTSTPTRDLAAP